MSLFDGGNFDPAARATGRYLPVESPMPGTTLGIIPLQAFVSGGTLYGEQRLFLFCFTFPLAEGARPRI